ncbi:MAG: hypothetical protein CMM95_02225 [Rickettsiales bacterium]|nr:hypothetical protein [Rickettsiales bacterium]|tara:strand:+ start:185 stop:460 length:276 start_codon:yes stop_codon:yes gene_type:complete
MTEYIVICLDRKNSLNKRLENRKSHLKHLKSLGKKLLLAGPILNKNNLPKGSLLILDFDNLKNLRKFLRHDPYSQVGLFKSITIEKFKRVF